MAVNSTITVSKAKKQINTIGYALAIYSLINFFIFYGNIAGKKYFGNNIFGIDIDLIFLILNLILLIVSSTIIFNRISHTLNLDIKDYLQMQKISIPVKWCITFMGFTITLLSMMISSFIFSMSDFSVIKQDYLGDFSNILSIIKNILYFITFVVVKPISDEYIFRGIVQRQLGHYNRYFGVFASSLLFALCTPSIKLFATYFFVGWYYSIITLKYHSIMPNIPIRIHIELVMWLYIITPKFSMVIAMIYILTAFAVTAISLIFNVVTYKLFVPANPIPRHLWKILISCPSIYACGIIFVVSVFISYVI